MREMEKTRLEGIRKKSEELKLRKTKIAKFHKGENKILFENIGIVKDIDRYILHIFYFLI